MCEWQSHWYIWAWNSYRFSSEKNRDSISVSWMFRIFRLLVEILFYALRIVTLKFDSECERQQNMISYGIQCHVDYCFYPKNVCIDFIRMNFLFSFSHRSSSIECIFFPSWLFIHMMNITLLINLAFYEKKNVSKLCMDFSGNDELCLLSLLNHIDLYNRNKWWSAYVIKFMKSFSILKQYNCFRDTITDNEFGVI